MTYLQFHLVFTLPLFFLSLIVNRKNRQAFSTTSFCGMGLLLFLAVAYTTPWDSYLIRENIWGYSSGQVLGSLWWIPYEEYFFFIIQTLIGCLVTAFILARKGRQERTEVLSLGPHNVLIFFISMTVLVSLWLTTRGHPQLRYLGLILIWAPPIALLQWAVGYPVLLKNKSTLFLVVTSLTAYFWLADSYAIAQKIWTFPDQTISGWTVLGLLPIEEALFFFMTNLMVVQGYILFTQVNLGQTEIKGPRALL